MRGSIRILTDDIVLMVQIIGGSSSGQWSNHWPSSTFLAEWKFSWDADSIHVSADWKAVAGRALELLREDPVVVLKKSDFLSEWRRPLDIVLRALQRSGYSKQLLPGMSSLSDALDLLPESGTLYRS